MIKNNSLFLFVISLVCWLSACTKHNLDTSIPLIVATPKVILSENGCLNIYQYPDNKDAQTNCYEFKYISLTTQIDWIDKLFAKEACHYFLKEEKQNQCEDENIKNINIKQIAKDDFNITLKNMKSFIEENKDEWSADSAGVTLKFIGQRNKIAQFRQENYIFHAGAAHPMYHHNYRVFDLQKKVELTLDDIVISKQKLLEKLREKYEVYYMNNLADKTNYIQEQEEAKKAAIFQFGEIENIKNKNFQLTIDGITFYFQPYEIGSFAEGVIELKIDTQEALGIIKEEYLLNY